MTEESAGNSISDRLDSERRAALNDVRRAAKAVDDATRALVRAVDKATKHLT